MKFKKIPMSLLFLLTSGLIIVILLAFHLQSRRNKLAMNSVVAQTSENHSSSKHTEPTLVPKTGQTRKFMTGDDGDLRVGKAWPYPRFTEKGNSTVIDHLTGLMWTCNANKANGMTDWEKAVSGARACRDGGFTDWRLPNRKELGSLIDLGRFNPALPKGHPFDGVQPSYYWTSSTPANNEDGAWVIHFYVGFVTHDDKGGSHYVWYVRGPVE